MPSPPRYAEIVIDWLCDGGQYEDIPGDLIEQYEYNFEKKSKSSAYVTYLWAALCLFQPFILKEKFKYNPRIAYSISAIAFYRNINKSKFRFLIVSSGLSLGLVFAAFIFHYINYELSYEKSYTNYQNIYRIASTERASTSPLFSHKVEEDFDEISKIGRMTRLKSKVVAYNNVKEIKRRGYYANNELLDIFSFDFIKGQLSTALTSPYTVVLTKSMAEKFFDKADPIGNHITIGNDNSYVISAVIEDLPMNSHIKVDYFVSIPTLYKNASEHFLENPYLAVMYNYTLLNKDQARNVNEKLKDYTYSFLINIDETTTQADIDGDKEYFELHPIASIHLESHRERELSANGDMVHIYVLISLAVIVLLIAGINFFNHSITQLLRRAKELNVRKAIGANDRQLKAQFLIEVFLALVAIGLCSIIISIISVPLYTNITGLSFSKYVIYSWDYLLILLGILCSLFVCGSVFSLFLIHKITAKKSVSTFKLRSFQISVFRKVLLTIQFSITLLVIIATVIMVNQMSFIENSDLGYDADTFLYVELNGEYQEDLDANFNTIINLLTANSSIESVSRVSDRMGDRFGQDPIRKSYDHNPKSSIDMRFMCTDKYFIPSINVDIIKGRNFYDSINEAIINEAAVEQLYASNVIGDSLFSLMFGDINIVGVVENFNYNCLHNKVEPLIIFNRPFYARILAIKINTVDYYTTVSFIEDILTNILPKSAYDFSFLKDSFDRQYDFEKGLTKIAKILCVVTLIMLYLGLQSLIGFIFETRNKEIAVRKVLGAARHQLISLLSLEFVVILVVATIITLPIGWFLSEYWLSFFEFRINSIFQHVILITGVSWLALILLIILNVYSALKTKTIRQLEYN